ncbi:MAG: 3-deoxy-manno-octulosonate cytidylyltransferase [Desulfovibrionaceae bacterium]|jgi:3-deoxy-manno-octulosonate cytidylyltransferase (CMP-KDO synthetase)
MPAPHIVAIVPARMGSSRLPGKPLADILGLPMVGHVALRTAMSPLLDATYVATCDKEIQDFAAKAGLPCVMTADTHLHCSDRTAEAMAHIERETGRRIDIVVMVQGDEPMVTPEMITAAVQPMLDDPSVQVVNLMEDIPNEAEFEDPANVKVVVDQQGNALYFSREPLPSRKKFKGAVPARKQVCIIPFRRDFLEQFNAWPETELERIESVDMLRVLEHGLAVRMVPTHTRTISVDTTEDLAQVRQAMAGDPLMAKYMPRG